MKTAAKEEPVLKDQASKPITLISEIDASISERIKSQPSDLSQVEFVDYDVAGRTRLSLPDYFEKYSHDCTQGILCKVHQWKPREEKINGVNITRWEYENKGKYIFRWVYKRDRAIDNAINIRGWYIASRMHFEDAPSILFSVSGGVEEGDSILMFMPFEKALKIRENPSRKSIEHIKAEETRHENNRDVYYKPKLDPEGSEGADEAPVAGVQMDKNLDF